jgi:hypothetical protein
VTALSAGARKTTDVQEVIKFQFPIMILKEESVSSQDEIKADAEYDESKNVDCVSRKFLQRVELCGLIQKVEARTRPTGHEHKTVFKEKVVLTWYPPEMKDSTAPYKTTFYLNEEQSLDVVLGSAPSLLEGGPAPSFWRRCFEAVLRRHTSINSP